MTSKKLKATFLSDLLVTDPDTGELIRKDTGEVISDNTLSQEKEWRSFDTEESKNRARVGTPISLAFHDMGLSTKIGKEVTDASGNKIDSCPLEREWEGFACGITEARVTRQQRETWHHAFSMLSRLKDRLGLPNHVTEKAPYTYRKA